MSVSGARAAPTLRLIESQGEQGINKVQYGLVRDLVSWRLGYTSWTMPQVSPVCSLHTCYHCNLSSNQADNVRKHMKNKLVSNPLICLAFNFCLPISEYFAYCSLRAGSSICRGRTVGGGRGETGKLYRVPLHQLNWTSCNFSLFAVEKSTSSVENCTATHSSCNFELFCSPLHQL